MLYREKKKQKLNKGKIKLKKGDTVVARTGKDKGKKGKVEKVLPKAGKIVVTGINVYKKHLKPRGEGKPGGIIEITKPILVSKVSFVCMKCGKQSRLGYQIIDNNKNRICRKCMQQV